MCRGVLYHVDNKQVRTYFRNPYAELPVRMRDGRTELLPWGRREKQPGRLPLGGWARYESIQAGTWDRWQKISVKLVVDAFMEMDMEGNTHWQMVTGGKFIQGLVATWETERRVYVVTITPELDDAIFDR